ncbi:hypothetical protein [Falsiroseomonas sp.]|nr:hypothetical protein [Falsiroseomonas sp.]MDP3417451.1 hypothetical protein [Falsiroseomonas sp.]
MTKKLPERTDYRFFLDIPTRWMDNDIYGHVNTLPRWCDAGVRDRT